MHECPEAWDRGRCRRVFGPGEFAGEALGSGLLEIIDLRTELRRISSNCAFCDSQALPSRRGSTRAKRLRKLASMVRAMPGY